MNNLHLKPLTLALAGAMIISQAALAAAPATTPATPAAPQTSLHEDISTVPGRSISPADEAVISSSASKVLHHIALARDALRRKDPDQAKQNLRLADTLLDIIQSSVPTTVVKDRIWTADKKLQYENSEEVSPSDIPIYASLEERAAFDAVKAAGVARDKPQAKAEPKPGAKDSSKELVADDTLLYYEEMDLPMNAVRHFVSAAQSELAKNRPMEADQDLRAAQDSVDYVSVALPEPLVTAKINLQNAHENFTAGKVADAKADLGRAITQLTRVEQKADPETKADAQKLLSDAQSLEARIDKGGPGLESELKGLWHHTQALADRAVEYTAVGWSRLRHHGKLRSDLIEAKRFMADADIDANVANDPARSMQDLRQAKDYLDRAEAVAGGKSDLEVYIKDTKAAVDTLIDGKAKADPGEMANLENQLGQAIAKL